MASFSNILSKGSLSTLGLHSARPGGVQDFFLRGAYRPAKNSNNEGMILHKVLADQFVAGLSYDFERFALSSRESYLVASAEKDEFGALGWPLLKFYYSSFFAAHAIMRARGNGIIKLDRNHVDHLNAVADIYDNEIEKIKSGMFTFQIVGDDRNSNGEISVLIEPERNGQGVHDGFWRNFCLFLDREASESVRNREVDSAQFVVFSSQLSNAIKNNPNGGSVWLSSVRNEINYQHKYESWAPFRRGSTAYKAFDEKDKARSETVRLDVSKDRKPIVAFLNITNYVSKLSFEVCENIARRSKKGGSFGQKWAKLNRVMGK